MDCSLIRRIEEMAADAWPAGASETLDGWRLRWHHGVTRRANSVLANDSGNELALEEKLAQVEAFYADRNAPTRFQMSPASLPLRLDGFLAANGFRLAAPTCVQTALLEDVLARTPGIAGCELCLREIVTEEWFAAYSEVDGIGSGAEARRAILAGVRLPTAYILLELGGEPATVGLGIAHEGWVGVFCMGTLPPFRRRGGAATVLRALAQWGKQCGAAHAYLQVMDENAAARALYARAGFSTLYHYWYRERPSDAPDALVAA